MSKAYIKYITCAVFIIYSSLGRAVGLLRFNSMRFLSKHWFVIVSSAYLVFTSNTVQAQTTFSAGLQAGLNTSTVRYSGSPNYNTTFPASYKVGFEAGLLGAIEHNHLTVQAAALFSQKGYNVKDAAVSTTNGTGVFSGNYRYNYLTLPINIAYTTQPNGQGFRVFAGPYLGILIGGNYNSTYRLNGLSPIEAEGKIVGGNNPQATLGGNDVYSKRVDAGLQAGIGYRYQSLLLQLNYSIGLRNLATDFLSNPTTIVEGSPYRNRAFQASLSYLLFSHK